MRTVLSGDLAAHQLSPHAPRENFLKAQFVPRKFHQVRAFSGSVVTSNREGEACTWYVGTCLLLVRSEGVWSCKTPPNHRILWKTKGQSRSTTQGPRLALNGPQEEAPFVRRPRGIPGQRSRHTGHPRARHGDAEDRRREGLTVPEHSRLRLRFFPSLRCPLVGPAGLARRRRVQLLSGQEFSYGQDLDAGMLAPR